MSSATFINDFGELVHLANTRGAAVVGYSKRDQK